MNLSEQAYIVMADFFSRIVFFFNMDFVIFLHSYCIRVCLVYNIVLLFGSHYMHFGSTRR